MSSKSSSVCLYLLLLLLVSGTRTAVSHWIVKTLPGFPGELPFKLETGYISVGEVEFFYYFVESEGNPGADPLLLYINGGPGCSALNGFLYQIGPLKFNITDYTGGLPTLIYEPNTWTKTANVLFLDLPVGAGFSYATISEAWSASDTKVAAQAYEFLRNWLIEHLDFVNNPVYLGSDSYQGIVTPILAQDIINGNEAGIEPQVNIKGLLLGCPHTNSDLQVNTRIIFAHRMALISDAMYKSAKTSCNGNYTDSTNANCTVAVALISQCIEQVNEADILGPNCAFISPKPKEGAQGFLKENSRNFILPWSRNGDFWCKNFDYILFDVWINYRSVQDALHVRPGTVKEVFRCNITLTSVYSYNVADAIPYHKNLTNSGLQILVFSGDHDMTITHIAVERWINALDLTIDTEWRPWFVDGQVAGYTRKYTNSGYRLTYATIKGAGHSPTEYKRKECYDMFHRWIHYYPL
ncbi:serine carboxypeptidase-like 7 isoform X1 [Quercus robur]|uniref:serine carboxypeptidase-like 7 isoform X1 n=1 Tax=Quercus robur TaxID=38942 RepID=UPI0021616F0C|nr:serine carboxypeptidase-like 7 isoform X1 [Quercus robur]